MMHRDGIQKAIDYMAAYSAGPMKFGTILSSDLVMASVRTGFSTIERAMQLRIDEEGCGSFFAAAKFHACTDTPCGVDSFKPCHSDMSGDLVGDKVTQPLVENQWLTWETTDLGSWASARSNISTNGKDPVTGVVTDGGDQENKGRAFTFDPLWLLP